MHDTGSPITVLSCVEDLIPKNSRNRLEFRSPFWIKIHGKLTRAYCPRPGFPEEGLNILGMDFLRDYELNTHIDWSQMTWKILGGGDGLERFIGIDE